MNHSPFTPSKAIIRSLLCIFLLLSTNCSDNDHDENGQGIQQEELGLTADNFPVIDGSDSTTPLRTILMCRLMGYEYTWERRPFTQDPNEDIKVVRPLWNDALDATRFLLIQKLQENNTHGSFLNLIDNKAELILTARSSSRDEKKYAGQKGVTLIEKPIARDAFIFMVNPKNKVRSLTVAQVQKIYTGEITNWKEVGGADAPIKPYIRNANSGSQEKFETVVMAGLKIKDFPEMQVGRVMLSPYEQLKNDADGIGFTPYYYYSVIVDNGTTRALALNGIEPDKAHIQNNSYPYVTDVYAAVRADVDRQSKAWLLFGFLTSMQGQKIIAESGYVPLP